MSAIRSKDTKPELVMRRELRKAGATGYRLHRRDLPGVPDLAYIRWRVAVFVDGEFWHGHPDHWHPDQASSDYWRTKIERNIARDRKVTATLQDRGWVVLRFWDSEILHDPQVAVDRTLVALRRRGWSDREVKG